MDVPNESVAHGMSFNMVHCSATSRPERNSPNSSATQDEIFNSIKFVYLRQPVLFNRCLERMSAKYIKTSPDFWSEPANRLLCLRIFVTAFIGGVAIIFGTLSYTTLKSYEKNLGEARYNIIASSALDVIVSDLSEKSDVVLSMAKNMAYFEPLSTNWPNVVTPGFYDSNVVLQNVASLDEVMFLPIVQPHQLSSFETFMYSYFVSEPSIPDDAGIPPSGRGVYAFDAQNVNGTYHDTTGDTTLYASPNDILVPITQLLFSSYLTSADLALNLHSVPQTGLCMDAIISCSKTANYTTSTCGSISNLMTLPFSSTTVESLHSLIVHPVYLNQNTSQLVGFTAGGFDWLAQVNSMFADYRSGVKVVVKNGASTLTFTTTGSGVRVQGLGDHHDSQYNKYERTEHFFATSTTSATPSTVTTTATNAVYTVSIYPSDEFFADQRTNTPLIACIVSVVLIILCYVKFIIYDRVLSRESTAKAAVLETKRRFVRFISHEIRTPLNAVHLGLEALTTEVRRGLEQILVAQSEGTGAKLSDLADMLRSWLELSTEMMGNSESAVDVLNDLLNYDKIEMGTLRLDFSAVPIWDIIQSTTVAFLVQAKQRNIHMTLDSTLHSDVDLEDGSKKFVCVGDAARLAQVMRNLISNAIKFTPNNGCIDIGVERVEHGIPHFHMVMPDDCGKLLEQPRAGSIRVSVTDSGAGLSEAQLARICSEGVQFNANELQAGKGSGLGMFITRGIIEQHGGKLTVASGGIGAGTTFMIELPLFHRTISPLWRSASSRFIAQRRVSPEPLFDLASSSADTEKSLSYTSKPSARQNIVGPAGPRRILVVDDASSNRKMLIRILTSNGYACEQAEDGKQAIEMFRASLQSGLLFYAITMDYEMPVMNGPTATKLLRDMGCTIPIIGVTGNLLPDDVAFYKSQGANDVLAKPLSLAKFEEFMHEHTMQVRRQVPRSGAGNEVESFSEEDC